MTMYKGGRGQLFDNYVDWKMLVINAGHGEAESPISQTTYNSMIGICMKKAYGEFH